MQEYFHRARVFGIIATGKKLRILLDNNQNNRNKRSKFFPNVAYFKTSRSCAKQTKLEVRVTVKPKVFARRFLTSRELHLFLRITIDIC